MITRNELAMHTQAARAVWASPLPAGVPANPGREDIHPIEDRRPLPETIDDRWTCTGCFALDACMLYRKVCLPTCLVSNRKMEALIFWFKAVEKVVDTTSDVSDLYQSRTAHITVERADFFAKWDRLLSLEEKFAGQINQQLWAADSGRSEISGRRLSGMALHAHKLPRMGSEYPFTYRFKRSKQGDVVKPLTTLIRAGDSVTLSVEPHWMAFTRGIVLEVSTLYIDILTRKAINILTVLKRSRASFSYRIDYDEAIFGMSRLRYNLASLFYMKADRQALELVVDLRPPVFVDSTMRTLRSSRLNGSQLAALKLVSDAQDYALIQGMPGTGKTFTIAAIVQDLVRAGKTILLTAYTHSALDNILMKLLHVSFRILRLGDRSKVSSLWPRASPLYSLHQIRQIQWCVDSWKTTRKFRSHSRSRQTRRMDRGSLRRRVCLSTSETADSRRVLY